MKRGYLFLIGGAEDREKDKHVLQHLVEQTRPGSILIIPTASAYPQDVYRSYRDAFRDLSVDEVNYLDIRYRDETEREEYFEAVEQADLIFLGAVIRSNWLKSSTIPNFSTVSVHASIPATCTSPAPVPAPPPPAIPSSTMAIAGATKRARLNIQKDSVSSTAWSSTPIFQPAADLPGCVNCSSAVTSAKASAWMGIPGS